MASSSVLAEALGARLRICWEPQDVLPVQASEVFSASFCDDRIISAEQAQDEFGATRAGTPHYLHRDQGRGHITLAGHDRGEQAFMPDLQRMLLETEPIRALVIAAGGQFLLPGTTQPGNDAQADFRSRRRSFYAQMPFRDETEAAVSRALAERCEFIGLHLRYSDRAHQAPLDRSIRTALRASAEASGITSVFIASDTAAARDRWADESTRLGLDPWFISHDSLARSNAEGSRAALVDWRVLANAQRLVYFAESSFAVEAAVAGPGFDDSIALGTSRVRRARVRSTELARAAATYPRRHGWIS